jgi:hypothetical protein
VSTVDDIRREWPGPASWKPTRNLPDLDAILQAHTTQTDGTCKAGCNWAGVLWQGGCPTWADAEREKARLLLDRTRGATDY